MSKQQTSISYEMFENLKNMFESKDEYDIELAKIYLKEIKFNSDPNDKWTQYYIQELMCCKLNHEASQYGSSYQYHKCYALEIMVEILNERIKELEQCQK